MFSISYCYIASLTSQNDTALLCFQDLDHPPTYLYLVVPGEKFHQISESALLVLFEVKVRVSRQLSKGEGSFAPEICLVTQFHYQMDRIGSDTYVRKILAVFLASTLPSISPSAEPGAKTSAAKPYVLSGAMSLESWCPTSRKSSLSSCKYISVGKERRHTQNFGYAGRNKQQPRSRRVCSDQAALKQGKDAWIRGMERDEEIEERIWS